MSTGRLQGVDRSLPVWNTSALRSEEHTSELQSLRHLVCRLLLESTPDHRHLHSFPTRRSSDLPTDKPKLSDLKLLNVDAEELEKRNEEIKSRFVEFFGA